MVNRREIKVNPKDFDVRWSCLDVLSSYIFIFIAGNILFLLFHNAVFPYINNQLIHLPEFLGIVIVFFLLALPPLIIGGLVFWLIYFFIVEKRGGKLNELGFDKKGLWLNLFVGIFVGILIAFFYKFISFIIYKGAKEIKIANLDEHLSVKLYSILIGGIISGIWQEVFFVGFMYSAFRKKFGRLVAFFITACFFSIHHIPPLIIYRIPKYFIHTIISLFLFEKRKSIIPSIVFHVTYNILV